MLSLPIDTINSIELQRQNLFNNAFEVFIQRLRVIECSVVPTTFTVIDPLEICESRATARAEALKDYGMDLIRIEANIHAMYAKADTNLSSLIQDTTFKWEQPQ